MNRSRYCDEVDQWSFIRRCGAVKSAIKGKRGQAFLKELRDSLDAMSHKALGAESLSADDEFCAFGVVGARRGIPMENIDAYDYYAVAYIFGISATLAQEIMFENNWGAREETGEMRWERMRAWVDSNIN